MKKISFLLVSLVFCIFLTGCVKYNASMEIKKDKSMLFTITYAVDTTVFGDTSIDAEQLETLKKEGYDIKDYVNGNMKGFVLTKSIDNIDSVSTEKDIVYDLSKMVNENKESEQYLFKVKRGFFKDTYTAKYTLDASNTNLNTTSDDESALGDENDTLSNSLDDDLNIDMSSLSNLDMTFNVKLPYSAKSHNATRTDDNNRTLSWSLIATGQNTIEFEFCFYNMTRIYIAIFVSIIVIVCIVLYFIKRKKYSR